MNSRLIGRKVLSVPRTLFGATFFIALAVASVGASERQPVVSICEVRSHPERYLNRTITVQGEAYADHHGWGIRSDECPGLGAELEESTALSRSNSELVEKFRKGVNNTFLCSEKRPFIVSVRARFATTKWEEIPIYTLLVNRVLSAEFSDGVAADHTCINESVPPPIINSVLPPT